MTFSASTSNSIIEHIFNSPQRINTYVVAKINWRKLLRTAMPTRKITFIEMEEVETVIRALSPEFLQENPTELILYNMPHNPKISDICRNYNLPLYHLDPGLYAFLYADATKPPLSFVVHPNFPYSNNIRGSHLYNTILSTDFSDPSNAQLLDRMRNMIHFIKEKKLSKYNNHHNLSKPIEHSVTRNILIIGDNPAKTDINIKFKTRDIDLVRAAKRDHPHANLVYKPHPFEDISNNTDVDLIRSHVKHVLDQHESIDTIFDQVDLVYTTSSQLGLDALIRGIPVITFGQPWYSGWGLTTDRNQELRKAATKTIEELLSALCFDCTFYFDWDTKQSITFEESLQKLYSLKVPLMEEADQAFLLKEARLALKNLDFITAKQHLLSLTTLFPSHAEGFICFADFHILQQNFAEAIACLSKAIEIQPTAVLYQARCMARLKNGEFSTQTDEDFKSALHLSKSKNGILYQYFSYLWEKEPISDSLFKQLDHALESIPPMQKTSKEYGKLLLLKACILNEAGQKSSAIKLQKQGVALGAADSTMLALRHTAWKYGNAKALSEYEAQYYPKMLEFNNRFHELVLGANGSVCLVGNAPSLIGSNLADQIDQHDLVVRFNNYSTDYPYSEDYGVKTDVWVRMPFHPYVKRDADPNLKLVMFTGSNRLYRPYTEWNAVLEYIERGFPVQFFPSATLYELQKALGCPPTAGLTLCYMLYKILGPLRPEQCLGFSFTDPSNAQGSYHYSDQNAASSARHDWDREAAFFNTLRKPEATKIVVPRIFRQLGIELDLSKANTTETISPLIVPKPSQPASTTVPQYDRIISISPGLADYKIYGKSVELISGAKTERHLKWLANPLKSEPADLLQSIQPHEKICVLGFGRAKTGQLAKQLAKVLRADYRLVEYGLISAMSLPSEKKFNFSLILDDCGIFYDTTAPSQIENMLLRDDDILQPSMLQHSRQLIDTIVSNNITKYNNSGDLELITARKNHRILVIDQTAGDNSIVYGQCETYSFRDMLLTALDQPNSDVILKLHPETAAGAKDGNLTSIQDLLDRPNLKVIGQQCNIVSLIKQVDEVYVMTSGVGLEALMIGKPVSCFGVPFYAGWGLTNDRVLVNNPRRQLSVESLFAATFLKYNLFYHPETQQPCSMEACIEWIVQNKPFFEPIKLEW